MKTVHINYFAILREQAGRSEESRTTDAETLKGLYQDLAQDHGFTLDVDRVKAAVDEAYVPMDTPLMEGMDVTFIPPVAGG